MTCSLRSFLYILFMVAALALAGLAEPLWVLSSITKARALEAERLLNEEAP